MNKNQGYGICGKKNVYSSKSRLGNWVEDLVGQDLVAVRRIPQSRFETEYSTQHCDPRDMVRDSTVPEVKLESVEVLKAKNKEGMPYSLLFEHNFSDIPTSERYQSTASRQLAMTRAVDSARPARDLERVKAKMIQREIDLAYKRTSESRASIGSHMRSNDAPSHDEHYSEDIPSFPKRCTLVAVPKLR